MDFTHEMMQMMKAVQPSVHFQRILLYKVHTDSTSDQWGAKNEWKLRNFDKRVGHIYQGWNIG